MAIDGLSIIGESINDSVPSTKRLFDEEDIDGILERGDLKALPLLKEKIDEINAFPVVERRQLELPVGLVKLKFLQSLWFWATGKK